MSQSIEALEEEVIFGEWRRLRGVSARSLQRTSALLDQLGYDPATCGHRIIGVVGSKGKGTASAYTSATLAGLGLKVGTVMSPGVLSNADRIRIDGQAIGPSARRWALERIHEARSRLPEASADSGYLAPTGLFLVMGFLIAQRAGVDVVVAEAGIGGLSDDLSHWPLDSAVVTSIFGEHLDILGPTVADVARDKTGVITKATHQVISCPQSPEAAQILTERCAEVGARLIGTEASNTGKLPAEAYALVDHLPAGFQRENAAAGVTAGLAPADGQPVDTQHLKQVVGSVSYPGRLSLHEVPGVSGGQCVVDSAVSGEGLEAALRFSASALGTGLDQVLVCLPPEKDLPGFISALEGVEGEKVFVELPGAYIGTPLRSQWPDAPGWSWLRLEDLGEVVHEAESSAQLLQQLAGRRSLAVGTVLFTSLVLRSLGADAWRLFTR